MLSARYHAVARSPMHGQAVTAMNIAVRASSSAAAMHEQAAAVVKVTAKEVMSDETIATMANALPKHASERTARLTYAVYMREQMLAMP